jgi:hypothetical protein
MSLILERQQSCTFGGAAYSLLPLGRRSPACTSARYLTTLRRWSFSLRLSTCAGNNPHGAGELGYSTPTRRVMLYELP